MTNIAERDIAGLVERLSRWAVVSDEIGRDLIAKDLRQAAAALTELEGKVKAQYRDMQEMASDFSKSLTALEAERDELRQIIWDAEESAHEIVETKDGK